MHLQLPERTCDPAQRCHMIANIPENASRLEVRPRGREQLAVDARRYKGLVSKEVDTVLHGGGARKLN